MHAASVYPEPGSNSPKKMHDLAVATSIRGSDHSHILIRISCHSSVVKVQRPGRDSPRRRPPMMGLGGRGVKPDDPGRSEPRRPVCATSVEAARARMVGAARGPVKRAGRRRVRECLDRAGLDEQDEGGAAQPGQERELGRAGAAERADEDQRRGRAPRTAPRPAFASRSRISATRLLIGSDRPPALERPDEGHLVGVLEIAADRQPAGDPGDDRRRPPPAARPGTSRSPRPRGSGSWRG